MRKKTGAILCPGCRQLIGVAEPRCPHCGRREPGLWGFGPGMALLFGSLDPTAIVVGSSILLYGVALLIDLPAALRFRGFLGILAPSPRALATLGMTGGAAWDRGHLWTILSAIYLHGGLLHILFNVMWIRDLGPAVAEIYGPARGFALFHIAGAAGFLASNILNGAPTIGASGAIFGLLAALIVHGRRSGRSLLTSQLLTWAVVLFAFGFVCRPSTISLMPAVSPAAG